MVTTTTISPDALRKGDRIIAVGDHTLRNGITVERNLGGGHVHIAQGEGAITSPDRYLDRYRQVTVERTRRQATRTFHGIKFLKQETGSWLTEDGKWEVEYVDDFETECDTEHPVRISAELRQEYRNASEWDRRHRWPSHVSAAIEAGRKGYLCPGMEVHLYSLWVAGSTGDGPEVVNREDTFADSASHLARFIKGEAKLSA